MCEVGYTFVLMDFFEFLAHVSDFEIHKPTLLVFFIVRDLPKMVILGYFAI